MKRAMQKTVLSFLLAFSVGADARLVIIQDDSVTKAQEEVAQKEAKLAQQQAKEDAKAQEQAAALKLLKDEADKVRSATVEFDKNRFNVVADRTEKIIHHYGIPPAQLPAHGGAGLDSPLWVAMNAIVPPGWRVFTDKAINAHEPVNWNGHSHNWIAILHAIGTPHRIAFDVDWNQQIVIVQPHNSAVDYLRDELERKNYSRQVRITVEADSNTPIPEGGEGVLVINGQAIKVRRTHREVPEQGS